MLLWPLLLLASVSRVMAVAGTCSYDDSESAPTDIDTEFCSNYITDHCASVTSLDPEKIATYV